MLTFLDINTICCTPFGYPLSYIELIGILTGLASVWLAAKSHILTWPIGLVNVVAFFFLFYQVRLYSDMLLQIFFFVTTCYGWYYWSWQDSRTETGKITTIDNRLRALTIALLVAGTLGLGAVMSRVHLNFPSIFPEPAAFPFADAATTIMSVAATFLLAKRKIEAWVLWICVDIVSVVLYMLKGITFTALLYAVFLVIASYGFFHWVKVYRNENRIIDR